MFSKIKHIRAEFFMSVLGLILYWFTFGYVEKIHCAIECQLVCSFSMFCVRYFLYVHPGCSGPWTIVNWFRGSFKFNCALQPLWIQWVGKKRKKVLVFLTQITNLQRVIGEKYTKMIFCDWFIPLSHRTFLVRFGEKGFLGSWSSLHLDIKQTNGRRVHCMRMMEWWTN